MGKVPTFVKKRLILKTHFITHINCFAFLYKESMCIIVNTYTHTVKRTLPSAEK